MAARRASGSGGPPASSAASTAAAHAAPERAGLDGPAPRGRAERRALRVERGEQSSRVHTARWHRCDGTRTAAQTAGEPGPERDTRPLTRPAHRTTQPPQEGAQGRSARPAHPDDPAGPERSTRPPRGQPTPTTQPARNGAQGRPAASPPRRPSRPGTEHKAAPRPAHPDDPAGPERSTRPPRWQPTPTTRNSPRRVGRLDRLVVVVSRFTLH